MAFEVQFALSAERDRNRIVEYLLNDLKNPQAAAHFLDELDGIIDTIGNNPLLFARSAEPRLNRLGYRKVLFMNYVALYVFETNLVRIARIFHQSQDYARLV